MNAIGIGLSVVGLMTAWLVTWSLSGYSWHLAAVFAGGMIATFGGALMGMSSAFNAMK